MKKVFSRVRKLGPSFIVAIPDDAPPVPDDAVKGLQRERHEDLIQEVKRTLKRGYVLLEERLLTDEWRRMHKELGSDMLYFLLKYASIFDL